MRDDRLDAAIAAALAGTTASTLSPAADALRTAYRSGSLPESPLLATPETAAAYAAYRMPATVGAIRAALRQLTAAAPEWRPATHLDLGAGTGAAAWAVARELPGVQRLTMLEQSAAAIASGRAILAGSDSAVLRAALWRQWQLPRASAELPRADLATIGYVLGELAEPQSRLLVEMVAAGAGTVLIVEPGTPAGYHRILAAREQLIGLGWTLRAPCPHQLACPLAATRSDWCHFAERVDRSALHRRLKDAERSFEDEKFAFVAASRGPAHDGRSRYARVIRRPLRRKGLVTLPLCTPAGTAEEARVSRRQGPVYRQATDTGWGDTWPAGPAHA